mgnify:CR=1 FL=1
MFSQLATRLPGVPGFLLARGSAARADRPVVFADLVRLAFLFIALLALSPAWVEAMGVLVTADPPAWGAFWMVVVTGGAGLVVLGLGFLFLWVDLTKRLARQD